MQFRQFNAFFGFGAIREIVSEHQVSIRYSTKIVILNIVDKEVSYLAVVTNEEAVVFGLSRDAPLSTGIASWCEEGIMSGS